MSSFVIYDLETGGLDSKMDRIMQFAGARVDENLNIIGEPSVLYCKMPHFYIPSQKAIDVTGITVEECEKKGLPEYAFAREIHKFFTEENDTVIMGYNNIKFDDEFSRHLFYRNYIPPYNHTFANGNSRWDFINLIRATYALRPEGINWVFDEEGKPSFKLDRLTVANGIEHENAHDAMADVYATIEMMRLIKEKQPRLFEYAFNMRKAKDVEKFFYSLNKSDLPIVSVTGRGVRLLYPLAFSKEKGRVFLDLTAKNEEEFQKAKEAIYALTCFNPDVLAENLYKTDVNIGGNTLPYVPLRIIRDNSCPFYAKATTLPKTEEYKAMIENFHKLMEHLNSVISMPSLKGKVEMILPHLRFEPAQFVEQELYDSFISDSESLVNMRLRNVLSENEVSVSKFIDVFKQGYNSDGVTNRGKRLFELFSATHFYEHPEMFREGMFEEIVEPRKAFYLERNKQEKGE
jgi:exodeoxyribonuclease I